MCRSITIVQFKVYDRDCEKNFYLGETLAAIHEALSNIGRTYVATKIIIANTQENSLLNELKKFQPNE